MKMTVDAGMMKEMFVNYDRDYYSFSGLETLLDYYDEIDPEMEFVVIARNTVKMPLVRLIV